MGDLFTYRIRMQCGIWYVVHDGDWARCGTYQKARDYANNLERSGYIDGDRGAA